MTISKLDGIDNVVNTDALKRIRELSGIRQKRYRDRHPERAKERDKVQRIKNSKRRAQQAKEWREANKDRVAKYQAEYEDKRRAVRCEARREEYKANPEPHRKRAKDYRNCNPEWKKSAKYRYRARKRGTSQLVNHTSEERQHLLINQKFLCANPYCHTELTPENSCIDHVVALANGGSNLIDNCQWLCLTCNSRKSNLPIDVWLIRESKRQ